MGLSPPHNCGTQYCPGPAPAPNPNSERWVLVDKWGYTNGYVLLMRYLDATNHEGLKVMVYRGKLPNVARLRSLDPHFTKRKSSPVARYRPDEKGIGWAKELAKSL